MEELHKQEESLSSHVQRSAFQGEKLEARIDRGLAGVCTTDKLRAYKFSPPTQVTLQVQVDQLSGENVHRHSGQISTYAAERPEGRISWRKRSNSGATD